MFQGCLKWVLNPTENVFICQHEKGQVFRELNIRFKPNLNFFYPIVRATEHKSEEERRREFFISFKPNSNLILPSATAAGFKEFNIRFKPN